MSAQAMHMPVEISAATYFGPSHTLASVAAGHCRRHRRPRLGNIACGACWELAIRDDERFVVECDLPREIDPDPEYVDEIAVDLACRGEQVTLTPVEFRTAVERLSNRRLTTVQIARRLHTTYAAVVAALNPDASASTVVAGAASPIRIAA